MTTAPANIVSTWMYVETPEEGGLYPQVGGRVSGTDVQNIYWRCVYTFFWSVQAFKEAGTGLRLVLFTNVDVLPTVDGLDLNAALADFGVEVITLRYTWAPKGRRRAWYNQYFLFDILEHAAGLMAADDAILVMDNDCVTVRDLAPVFARLRVSGALLMTVGIPEDEDANGISRRGTIDVYEKLGHDRPGIVPEYFGGEFYGLTGAMVRRTVARAVQLRLRNDALAEAGSPYLSDEAHLFSAVMWGLGQREPNANDLVRRIWTTWKLNDTRSSDLDLTIWHLPSEKVFGLRKLFGYVRRRANTGLDQEHERSRLAALMGVGRRHVTKMAGHLAQSAGRSIWSRRRRAG